MEGVIEMSLKFHKNGLYVAKNGDVYTLGFSEKGQDDVGEVMFTDLPDFGNKLEKGDTIIGVEGAKAVTDFTAPIAGEIVEFNKAVEDEPELLNDSDLSKNWVVKLTAVDEAEFNALNDEAWPEGEGPSEDE